MRIIINLMLCSVLSSHAASHSQQLLAQIGLTPSVHPYLGIHTVAGRTYGMHEQPEGKTTIVQCLETGILPERPFQTAEAIAQLKNSTVDEFGTTSLQLLQTLQNQQFAINPVNCSVVQLLLTADTVHIRSCTYITADDGSPRVYPHAYETSLSHTDVSTLTFSDAYAVDTASTLLATSATEHAQATCGDNPLQVVVDLNAWREQLRDAQKQRTKNCLFGCFPFR